MLAHQSDKAAGWSKPVDLRLINVEALSENFESLRYYTGPWEKRGIVTNIEGVFGKSVSEILSRIGSAPALFFIDPYGPTAILFSYLEPILRRTQQKTELIINFDHDGLRRLTDQLFAKANTAGAAKSAQTMLTRAKEIVGSDRWKSIFETTDLSTHQREQVLLREYMENLARYDYMVYAYPIRELSTKPTKYYLVHCTRHHDAIELMNSFICEEEDAMLQDSADDPEQPMLFDLVQHAKLRRREELMGLILGYAHAVRRTTRGQIKKHFIYQHLGVYHEKEYNAVVKQLIAEGTLHSGRKNINDEDILTYMPKQESLL
jgi:three-Cys-motif partner protein